MNATRILDQLQASNTGIVTVQSFKGRAPGVGKVQGNNKVLETVMYMASKGILRIVNDTNNVAKTNGYKMQTRNVSYTLS